MGNAARKNITVSVDEETYKQARLVSVLRDTSVSALVRDYLTGLTVDAEKQGRLERGLGGGGTPGE